MPISESDRTPEPGWYGADPTTTNLKPDPHSHYAELRESQPVNLTPFGDWRLCRYEDVQQLLKRSHAGVRRRDGIIPGESRADSDNSRFMLRLDPPDHDRIRHLVTKAFTPRALAAIRPAIEPVVSDVLDQAISGAEIDLVTELALTAPAASMCAMLGVPFEDRHHLSDLVSVATYRLAGEAYPDLQPAAEEAIMELAAYMVALIEQRRKTPTEDILGLLVSAKEAGDSLSNDELIQQSIGLLIAGLETTIGLIGNGMMCFSRFPEQLDKLAQSPSLASGAVEECLRFEPSVPMTRRVLWEDTAFGDYVIPADATVYAVMIAANRDPAVFTAPNTFNIERQEAKHCSFGGGIHFCLGSHLARMNAEVAFTEFARRCRSVEVDEKAIEWAPSLFRIPGRIPARIVLR